MAPEGARPLRVLCLDLEGGYGGSSRSLFESLRHIDRAGVAPEVWCRRAGPAQALYQRAGIPCRVAPAMPKVSSLPRLTRNLLAYSRAAVEFRRAHAFRRQLLEAARARFDLVHFNHEGLFLLAGWLARRSEIPLTMHVRTMLADTPFARWQVRRMLRASAGLVYITENERANVARLGHAAPGPVIHNIAVAPEPSISPHPAIPADGRRKIASLSNYAWVRGTDRLIDIAARLRAEGRADLLFVVAGEIGIAGSPPGALGRIARAGGTLADYARERGVAEMFLFLGHVSRPESVLLACDALIRPSRESNPWGRDIIEAMAAGKPVFAIGRWPGFVRHLETGFLYDDFEPGELARDLARFADDAGLRRRLGNAARARVAGLCDGPARAADLLEFWQSRAAPAR